jgi:type III pantothenate kinase
MILAVDIGNSNIITGCIDKDRIRCIERISTNSDLTPVEYAMRIKAILEMYGIDYKEIEGAVISSVVPQLTPVLNEAVEKLLDVSPLIVSPGLKTGLNIRIDDPAQLGSSLLVYSVAALAEHEPPFIVIEMGTATTFCTVNRQKQYVGGVICAGVRTALDSLVSNTSLLHQVNLEKPEGIIGRNTADGLRSGIIYGTAACIDGVADRIEEELGEKCTMIATGTFARFVIPHCRRQIIIDEELMLKGLKIIYEKNRR